MKNGLIETRFLFASSRFERFAAVLVEFMRWLPHFGFVSAEVATSKSRSRRAAPIQRRRCRGGARPMWTVNNPMFHCLQVQNHRTLATGRAR